ncbi:MAG TPA: TrkH family potassium uptake protein, partial [Kiritimatiellia bacterium]|nr:TrkH family potassium uptake protein [Kiritimatiellia bacterium]
MNFRVVFHLVSHMLLVIAGGMAAAWGVSLYAGDPSLAQLALGFSCLGTLVSGLILKMATRGDTDLTRRDGFGIVTLGWLFASAFSALPFMLSGIIPHPVSAFFEAMSGYTTTGATVIPVLEGLPRGILFWRALTHFFGGMGVLVLCVAILPFLGVGGMQIFRAEMPGPSKDRLTPRITTTAKWLWGVYVFFTAIETGLLRLGGMSWFDAVCHSFATMATGGFSTRTVSIMAYQSPYIEAVITVFMFLAAANFALHYRALQGKVGSYFRDPEFRFYLALWTGSALFVSLILHTRLGMGALHALRLGFFQVTSIMSTTGFATADFERWPFVLKFTLILLMFVGGCSGSTGGGIKVVRLFVLAKAVGREIRLFMQPQAVLRVRLGEERLEPEVVSSIMAFVAIFVLLFLAGTAVMCFFTPDFPTAASSVAATLGNIGPGLGLVGPMSTYATIPPAGQAVLIVCMLLGRLELYTVLVMLLPGFWK